MVSAMRFSPIQKICILLLTIATFASFRGAWAGSLAISPVKLNFSGGRLIEAISVRNDSDQPSVVQVETAVWSQQSGKDMYAPTQDLLATPPIFTIPAGATQIIRVGTRHPADPRREQAYRLFLQEVPPPQKISVTGLQLALRISVPVFVAPMQPAEAKLKWSVTGIDAHTLKIDANNIGNSHEHISTLKLYRANSQEPLVSQQVFNYVLAGQAQTWSLNSKALPASGEALRLVVTTEAGEAQTELVMGAAP